MIEQRPLALVVQRYGEEIVGGSEALCRAVAEFLAVHRPVEVLTTCARDYMSWRNEYPAGSTTLNGVLVRRFPVDFERDQRFHEVYGAMLGGLALTAYDQHKELLRAQMRRSSDAQQMEFLRLQGPYSTPLWDHLRSQNDGYDRIVFFTYLYATTFFGSQQVPPSSRFDRASPISYIGALGHFIVTAWHCNLPSRPEIIESYIYGASAIVHRSDSRIGDKSPLIRRRHFPKLLGDRPGPVGVINQQSIPLTFQPAVHRQECFGGWTLQKCARLRIHSLSCEVVGGCITDVELDGRIELNRFYQFTRSEWPLNRPFRRDLRKQ